MISTNPKKGWDDKPLPTQYEGVKKVRFGINGKSRCKGVKTVDKDIKESKENITFYMLKESNMWVLKGIITCIELVSERECYIWYTEECKYKNYKGRTKRDLVAKMGYTKAYRNEYGAGTGNFDTGYVKLKPINN